MRVACLAGGPCQELNECVLHISVTDVIVGIVVRVRCAICGSLQHFSALLSPVPVLQPDCMRIAITRRLHCSNH